VASWHDNLAIIAHLARASQPYGFNASEQIAQIQHLTVRTTVS